MWFLDLTHGYKQGKRRAATNTDERRKPQAQIYGKRKGRLTDAVEQRRRAEELWYVQVDAAAKVGAAVEG